MPACNDSRVFPLLFYLGRSLWFLECIWRVYGRICEWDEVHQKGGHNGVLGRVGLLVRVFLFLFLSCFFLTIGRWAEAEADGIGVMATRVDFLSTSHPPSSPTRTDKARLRGPSLEVSLRSGFWLLCLVQLGAGDYNRFRNTDQSFFITMLLFICALCRLWPGSFVARRGGLSGKEL